MPLDSNRPNQTTITKLLRWYPNGYRHRGTELETNFQTLDTPVCILLRINDYVKAINSSFLLLPDGRVNRVVFSKQDKQTFTNEFESHWVPHSHGLVPHLCQKLSK